MHANGRDLLPDLATDGQTEAQAGEVLYADLGAAGAGSGALWIETSGRVLGEGGIRIEVQESGTWREVAVHTPREVQAREVVTGITGPRVRLVFLGAHHLHGLGWFDARQASETRHELAALGLTHSRTGALPPDATFSLAGGDTAWVDFPLLADPSTDQGRDWFVEVDGRPMGYQPSAALLGARHAPATEAEPKAIVPTLRLLGALPNPARNGMRLAFELPSAAEARLELFDPQGRRVQQFVNRLPAGRHFVEWDRRDQSGARVAPGVYQLRLTAAGRSETKSVVLLP